MRAAFGVGLAAAVSLVSSGLHAVEPAPSVDSFYELKTNALDGKPYDLGQHKGKVALVVNVASQCGYTPQYKGLQALREEMKGRGFEVLGFPSNDFGGQEPGSPEEIATFCRKNYGVSFPMMQKLVTKEGPEQSPIYAWLGQSGNLPKWNFSKYVIGKDGKVRGFFGSKVTPEDAQLRQAIEQALTQ
jgi:glutathione peroxidase